MSFYSSIDRRINADDWFRGLSHDAQLVWLRLLIGPHVTPVAGLWPAREGGLADDFGFSLKRFREVFSEISRDSAANGLPRAVADWRAGVLWLPNSIKQECNQPRNWKVLRGWLNYLEVVPECDVSRQALKQFSEWLTAQLADTENSKRFNIAKDTPNHIVNDIAYSWRNGKPFRIRNHIPDSLTRGRARDLDQEREKEKEKENAQPSQFVDSDLEKPMPLDFQLHPTSLADMAKTFGCSTDVILEAVREFVGYWTIGGGAGKARAHWQSRCREDIRKKHEAGKLAEIARKLGEGEAADAKYGTAEDGWHT